jgi:hypothetical protein
MILHAIFHSGQLPIVESTSGAFCLLGGVQSGLGEKGVARGRVFARNVEPKEPAGGDLLADFQRIRCGPDPGCVHDHCRHGPAPKSYYLGLQPHDGSGLLHFLNCGLGN